MSVGWQVFQSNKTHTDLINIQRQTALLGLSYENIREAELQSAGGRLYILYFHGKGED